MAPELEIPIVDTGAAAELGVDTGNDNLGADSGAEFEYGADEGSQEHGQEPGTEQRQQPTPDPKEEPEASEFTSSVSSRMRGLVKQVPKLGEVFKENPKVQEQIEATFRRESAYREVFPTVAEARALREHFPGGVADVQQVMADLGEVEALDKDFYGRDGSGNYPGHERILENMFKDDRTAAASFLRNIPKQWARLDPEGYNEKMGAIVGATLQGANIPGFITKLVQAAQSAKQDALVESLTELLDWTKNFSGEKREPSEGDRKLQGEREAFQREKQSREQEDFSRFRSDFNTRSKQVTSDIVSAHSALKRLEKVQGITPEKRAEIAEEVRVKMANFLKNSRSFMSKLTPAWKQRNLEETMKLQRSAWSQPWLLNRMVREVMKKHTPALVGQNRQQVKRPAQQQQRPNGQQQQITRRTQPFKEGKNWHHPDGRRMSVEETMRLPDELIEKYK